MTATPVFAQTPRAVISQISAANTNRDGTGTTVEIFAPGASGSRVDRITIEQVGTTTAGVVRLYFSPDAGTTKRLIHEEVITAVTPSSTVAATRRILVSAAAALALMLVPSGCKLYASTEKAETFNILVEGGDF